MIERIAIYPGNEDVLKAVIVVIADGYTSIVTRALESGLFGNIFEVTFPVVFEEPVVIFRGIFNKTIDICAVCEENVRFSVIVVVKNSDPPAMVSGA